MTDLSQVLPDFPVAQYARLLPAIEKSQLTVTDLLTLEIPDIGKRTQLPLLDVKRLCNAILASLHADLGVGATDDGDGKQGQKQEQNKTRPEKRSSVGEGSLRQTGTELLARPWRTISTLDASLDAALGGGVPTGYITEITGESGAGKTQFLLTLLLSVQLPPPHGLGRPALYISTEAALSTKRLSQILAQNPFFRALSADTDSGAKPSLDRVISTVTPDLESQDHILTYQVPVEVARRGVGLIVMDSVAANYRAEFERGSGGGGGGGSNMAARSAGLVRLGHLLRELARKHDLAVVVANQVADRFSGSNPFAYVHAHAHSHSSASQQSYSPAVKSGGGSGAAVNNRRHQALGFAMSQESPLASRSRNLNLGSNNNNNNNNNNTATTAIHDVEPSSSTADIVVRSSMPEPPPEDFVPAAPAALSLDHQQRWFTGWGDDPYQHLHETLKTPSLGLVWSTQIAARIALFRRPAYGRKVVVGDDDASANTSGDDGGGIATTYDDETPSVGPYIKSWRRWMKVVFAPHVPGTGPGLEGAVEFEVVAGGLKGVERVKNKKVKKSASG
ncbi:DNA repair protein RAD57 [Xylaria cf. heliscus]|nr:DNA repair protein RAD57 [Xylaria cf. heliscus]